MRLEDPAPAITDSRATPRVRAIRLVNPSEAVGGEVPIAHGRCSLQNVDHRGRRRKPRVQNVRADDVADPLKAVELATNGIEEGSPVVRSLLAVKGNPITHKDTPRKIRGSVYLTHACGAQQRSQRRQSISGSGASRRFGPRCPFLIAEEPCGSDRSVNHQSHHSRWLLRRVTRHRIPGSVGKNWEKVPGLTDLLAFNVFHFGRLQWVMVKSLAKTLANKHKTTSAHFAT